MFTALTLKIEVSFNSFKNATIKVLNGQVHLRAMRAMTASHANFLGWGR